MQDRNDETCVAITGRGFVSSLGSDVQSNCAAARAGLIRAMTWESFPVLSPGDGDDEGLKVHAAPLWTHGFEGDARLLRLLQGALIDLQRQTPQTPWLSRRVAFYLSLPDPKRQIAGLDLIVDEKDRLAQEEESLAWAGNPPGPKEASSLLVQAAQLAAWRGPCDVRCVTFTGHTGIAECLAEAQRDLIGGNVEVAIVGGADSMLGEDLLLWLHRTGRLKTPENPIGLTPGEAAVFVVLELPRAATRRGGHIWGLLEEVCFSDDDRPLLSGLQPLGLGLTKVIASIAGRSGWLDGQPVWLTSDQNGEFYRAMEWGHAIVRCSATSWGSTQPILWHPAGSFGDIGAVSCAAALCLVTGAFDRGYAPAPAAVLLSSADGGRRSATRLRDPARRAN